MKKPLNKMLCVWGEFLEKKVFDLAKLIFCLECFVKWLSVSIIELQLVGVVFTMRIILSARKRWDSNGPPLVSEMGSQRDSQPQY